MNQLFVRLFFDLPDTYIRASPQEGENFVCLRVNIVIVLVELKVILKYTVTPRYLIDVSDWRIWSWSICVLGYISAFGDGEDTKPVWVEAHVPLTLPLPQLPEIFLRFCGLLLPL